MEGIIILSKFIMSQDEFLQLLESLKLLNHQQVTQVSQFIAKKQSPQAEILSEEERLFLQSVILSN
ncbi:hypothetical protein BIY21_12395 [Vibrio ponticus]|uniref:Uncharacterized protein n=1 Tax=Vibrio ponticus TaxID=265668 RepID=A0ABX3FKF9_9VIBR|nr:hypothetical protein BIY21_12395 [Vibrio ponticus]